MAAPAIPILLKLKASKHHAVRKFFRTAFLLILLREKYEIIRHYPHMKSFFTCAILIVVEMEGPSGKEKGHVSDRG